MADIVRISNLSARAMVDAWVAMLGATARVELFDGTMPATCEAADDGTKLASLAMSTLAMAASTDANPGATATANAITAAAALATGTATYCRVKTSSTGVCHGQGPVGTSGDVWIVLDTTSLVLGTPVNVAGIGLKLSEVLSEA